MTSQNLNQEQKEILAQAAAELLSINKPTEFLTKLDELHYCSLDDSLNDDETIKENLALVIQIKSFINTIKPILEN